MYYGSQVYIYMYPLDLYKNFALYWYEKKIKNIISFLPIEKKFGSAGDSKQEFFLGLTLSTTITTAGPVYNVTLHLGSGHYLWVGGLVFLGGDKDLSAQS